MKKLHSAQKSVIGKWGRGVSQVGCPFLGGLRSEWMKSGHGGRGGQIGPKMGGRPLYTVPNSFVPKTELNRPLAFLNDKA